MKAIGGLLLPLIPFLLVTVVVRGDGRTSLSDGAVANPVKVKAYWETTLPNTPMPRAMLDILVPPQDEKTQGSRKFPGKFGHKQVPKKEGDDKEIRKFPLYFYDKMPNKEGDDKEIRKFPLYFYDKMPKKEGDDQELRKFPLYFYDKMSNKEGDDKEIRKFPLYFYDKMSNKEGDDKKIRKFPLYFYDKGPNNNGGDEEMGEGRKHIHHHEHAHVHLPKGGRDVFFFEDNLVTGSVLTIRIASTITNVKFLHQDASKNLPFSYKNFNDIINMFGQASHTMADDIAWTLRQCDHTKMIHGEIAGCATSIESFVELVVSSLGTNNVRSFSSGAPNEGVASLNYTLASVNLLTNENQSVLVCHDMPYPYKVFYCHTATPSRAYQLKLVSDVGLPSMDGLVVCHLNTSTWDPDHPFFQVMHVKPGIPFTHQNRLAVTMHGGGGGKGRREAD
ncbi:hypothetical protein GUJ93_ZPchr0006g43831 [Zizania palustris]|uniref:BURP domain-containing protein n=1 Tax=Zizania palustris TaxID=103762 RepID=A0A8J5VQB0_ZIZPA|nr:hypothetical protein GUJ93_ZPchr0006g43831 [Zizania palustris]